MIKGRLRCYVRGSAPGPRKWQEVPVQGAELKPPEPFSTCYIHPQHGELWIYWVWVPRGDKAWTPTAVRAVVQPSVFADEQEIGKIYAEALELIGKNLLPDENFSVPYGLDTDVVSPN